MKLLKPIQSKTNKLALLFKQKNQVYDKLSKVAVAAEKARYTAETVRDAAEEAATKAREEQEKVVEAVQAATDKCKEYAPEKRAKKGVIKTAMKATPSKPAKSAMKAMKAKAK